MTGYFAELSYVVLKGLGGIGKGPKASNVPSGARVKLRQPDAKLMVEHPDPIDGVNLPFRRIGDVFSAGLLNLDSRQIADKYTLGAMLYPRAHSIPRSS